MSEQPHKLYLIDGHALAYRQYFAPGTAHLATAQGEPTNATLGFARTLLDLLSAEHAPEFLAVVFDQGLSGREIMYQEYKSTRAKMEDSLVIQMERIREVVQAFNIPILEKDGYEADDVIGSAARQAVPLGVDVHIITGDHDLVQLVNDHVRVELPGVRGGDAKIFDEAGVRERFGISPAQIPDYKGLIGDNSDNIPGVTGIGEKTAPGLLQRYGTLENLYEHLGEIKGATRTRLEGGRDSAFLSKQLATIKTDIPLTLELEKCAAHDYDPQKAAKLFRALEFNSLLRRLEKLRPEAFEPKPETADSSTASDVSGETHTTGEQSAFESQIEIDAIPAHEVVRTVIVDTEEVLAEMLSALALAEGIAFDTETNALDQTRAGLVGISLAGNGDVAYYIPVGHMAPDAGTLLAGEPPRQLPLERVIEALRPLMTDPAKPKYAHNAAYDLNVLRRYGLDVTPITFDTLIADYLARPEGRRGLKELARTRLGIAMTKIEELIGKGKNQLSMAQVPVEMVAPYAAADAAITCRLVPLTRADLERTNQIELFEALEMPLVPVIVELNMTGARLDLPYITSLGREFAQRLDEIKAEIYKAAGQTFNIGSLKQLNDVLFEKLRLPTKGLRKSQHGWSLDADALETLRPFHPVIGFILDWRSLDKLRSTYVDALPRMVDEEGRVHTTYNQTGSVTGRISSENPNLQNIPVRTEEGRRVRRAFIAAPGNLLLSVDYSQIELRVLAHYSQDEALLDAFRHNQDIHRATAALVSGIPFDQVSKEQRYFAKRVNFGLIYGMGASRLSRESELSREESKKFIEDYFTRLPGVRRYLDGSKQRAYDEGYLETVLGRRRDFSRLKTDLRLGGGDRARMEREAINFPIQGSAADIMKVAMIRLHTRLKAENWRARMILQVHDELVLEVPESDVPATAAVVREVMEGAFHLDAPLRAEANVGMNWADMQPVEEWVAMHS
jgi:DNA polymerase-1